MTVEEHLRMMIGDLVIRVAQQAAEIDALKAQLKKRAGRDVTIDASVDPDILGGIVIKLGSEMIDASIRTKLNRLTSAMKG